MPTITLKISDAQRELWVTAADREGCSLSEWLRRAAMTRSGEVDGLQLREGQVSLADEEVLFQATPRLAPEREWRGPDFKKEKKK